MNKNKALVLCALTLFSAAQFSCGTTGGAVKRQTTPSEYVFWNTPAVDGSLTFLGAGGIQMYENQSIEKALEDAARKAAFFNSISGTFTYYEDLGAGFWDYVIQRETKLSYDENYKRYIDSFEYDPEKDVIINEMDSNIGQAAFVRVRYKTADIFMVSYPASGSLLQKPDWVDNPPSTIGGYIAGVGYARPQMYKNQTYTASYEAAVIALICKGPVQIESTYNETQADSITRSTKWKNMTKVSAAAQIDGFYVLQTWFDPETHGVYTLAVAKSVQGQ
jgi:hypothetical protein